MCDYIYLIRLREFLKTGELIYKIGRSKQVSCKRINDYPTGSSLECIFKVDNCIEKEKELIKLFSEKFNRKKEIGNEYFEGDRNEMVKLIFDLCYSIDYKNEKYEIEDIEVKNEIIKEKKKLNEDEKKVKLLKEKENIMKRKLKIEKIKNVLEKNIEIKKKKIENELKDDRLIIKKFIDDNLEKGNFDKEEKGKKTYFITLNELKEMYRNNGSYDKKKLKELKDYIEKETNEYFEEIKTINSITYRNVLLNYKRINDITLNDEED